MNGNIRSPPHPCIDHSLCSGKAPLKPIAYPDAYVYVASANLDDYDDISCILSDMLTQLGFSDPICKYYGNRRCDTRSDQEVYEDNTSINYRKFMRFNGDATILTTHLERLEIHIYFRYSKLSPYNEHCHYITLAKIIATPRRSEGSTYDVLYGNVVQHYLSFTSDTYDAYMNNHVIPMATLTLTRNPPQTTQ